MAKPILLITRRLPPEVEARAARDYAVIVNNGDTAQTALPMLTAEADAILCSPGDKMDAAAIAALPGRVRALGTFSVGFDHIDLAAATARGIGVVNTPDVLSVTTAETALMLMLMAARRAGEAERLVRAGGWTGWAPTQLLGQGVVGRRLGIFGMGRIGREFAKLALGIGMEVHYRDIARLPPELEMGCLYHDNDDSFLPICDLLSLNAPGGDSTRHWLNAARIAKLPRGAVVVNAARGTMVDDAALIAALKSGQVAAAGLDVYNGEPAIDPGYVALENTVLLPHLGSATVETRNRMGALVLDGLDAVLAGRDPPNRVR
jgi:lactate dehydrogenase-like 2-hydroxyacid dehydrogenase